MSETTPNANQIFPPEKLAMIKDQLLIVLANRLEGVVIIPVAELDGTGEFIMDLAVDQAAQTISLNVKKKH